MYRIMPEPLKRNKARDKAVIKDYLAKKTNGKPKYSPAEIAVRHKFSTTRLYQVLGVYKVKKRKKNVRGKAKGRS